MKLSRNARGGDRKRGTLQPKLAAKRDKNLAKKAAATARATAEAMADLAEPEYDSDDEQPERVRDAAQEERSRQLMIWKFVDMGSLPEDKWSGPGGVLAEIRKLLGWHYNRDVAPIRALLRRHLNDEPLVKPRAGRPAKLTQGEALIGADCLESGKGRGQAAHEVTAWRQLQGKSAVSEKAVRTGFKRLDGVTQRRGTDGTGSRDVESAWALASLAEAEQFTSQIVMPEEEERAAAEQEVEAAATGPWLKVEGRRVRSLADDPLHVIGKSEYIVVPYSWWHEWWRAQPAKIKRKTEKCELVGYVASYKHGDGAVEPAYIIKCSGDWGCFAMRAADVVSRLPLRLQPAEATVDEACKVTLANPNPNPNPHSHPNPNPNQVPLASVSWWDEKHKKVVLSSHASKWEHRFPRSPGGTNYMSYEDGGKLLPRQRRKKAKFTGDGGRFGFGVMMKKAADGTLGGAQDGAVQLFRYEDGGRQDLQGARARRARARRQLHARRLGRGWARRVRGDGAAARRPLPGALRRWLARGAQGGVREEARWA